MTEKISTLEVRQRLGDILNRVALRNDQFIIERKGKPLAAVVPVERLEQMRRAAGMHLLQVLERQQGKKSEAEAERGADEAKDRPRKTPRRGNVLRAGPDANVIISALIQPKSASRQN